MLPIPALLATSAIHQHLVSKGLRTSHRPRGRDRLGARSASLRAARRLRRRGGASVPRARDAGRARRAAARASIAKEALQDYIKAIGKGLQKVMSKMGISHLHVLLRRADLRGGRACRRRSSTSTSPAPRATIEGIGVFEVAEEAHAPASRRVRRRSGARRRARRRRRIRLARARRRAHVDARRDRQAAARDAREQLLDLQGVRAAHQRPVAAAT